MIVGEYSLRCTCNTCGKYQEYTTGMRGTHERAVAWFIKRGWVFNWNLNTVRCPHCVDHHATNPARKHARPASKRLSDDTSR